MTTPQLTAVLGRGVVREADVSADDLGLTRGDGIFEAMRVLPQGEGRHLAENLDRHLDRLAHSARLVELEAPDLDAWRSLVDVALAAWAGTGEAVLKLMLTRGAEHHNAGPTSLLTITEHEPGARRPLRVASLSRGYAHDSFADAPWLLGGAKLLSYAVHTSAKREAARRGFDDALFVSSDGYVLEMPTASVVWLHGGTLSTIPTGDTGILASITVDLIAQWAKANKIEFTRELTTLADLTRADAVWAASSVRGVCPITAIDATQLAVNSDWTAKVATAAGF